MYAVRKYSITEMRCELGPAKGERSDPEKWVVRLTLVPMVAAVAQA